MHVSTTALYVTVGGDGAATAHQDLSRRLEDEAKNMERLRRDRDRDERRIEELEYRWAGHVCGCVYDACVWGGR